MCATVVLGPFGACADDGGRSAASPVRISIDGFRFQPQRLEVRGGTTVTWTNADEFAHTVTGDDESFDSGELGVGMSFEQTFGESGEYPYTCAIHNYMTGTIVVG